VAYPACCGMPKLELGDIEAVAAAARQVTAALLPWIDKGYDVIALTPSCALMLKFEWPLILPKDQAVERLSQATFDVSEYVVDIAKKDGLAPGLEPIEGGVQRAPCLSCPRAEHGRQGGRDAAPGAQDASRRHRALQRPWRHLGARTENFRSQ